jgi:hypothetical protein
VKPQVKPFSEIYLLTHSPRVAEAKHQNNSPQPSSHREGEQRDYNQKEGQTTDPRAYQGYAVPQEDVPAYTPVQRQSNQSPSSMMDKVNKLAAEFSGKK